MSFSTADLCDAHAAEVQVAEPHFRHYGQKTTFHGPIYTIKTFEDNTLVRAALETPGDGKVLVVDGEGSKRCALVGDNLARLAIDNGWSGIVVNGCIRDSAVIDSMPVGIKALATNPLKSAKDNYGEENVPVLFAGVTFNPGAYLYADADGIIVSAKPLLDSE